MGNIEASVIIPSRNSSKTIEKLLTSIFNQTYPRRKYEVIVSDSSIDDTREKLSKFPIRLVKVKPKKGRNSNLLRNVGAKTARGNYLLFIDSDCEVPSNWISEILKQFKNKKVACVGGNIVSKGNIFDDYVNSALKSPMRKLSRIYTTSRENFHKRLWPIGGNIAFKKSIFRELGGFSPNLKYYEEVDILWRLCKQNYYLILTPKTIVTHHYNKNFIEMIKTYFRYGNGCGNFVAKNFESTFSKIRIVTYLSILFIYFAFLKIIINFFEIGLLFIILIYLIFSLHYLISTRRIQSFLFPLFDFIFIGISFIFGMTTSLFKNYKKILN